MKKLTIIGGGSVRAPFFAHSLAKRAAQLDISTLCLYDIDAEKLRIIGSLARHAAARINPGLRVITESDPRKAIEGSDYFVTTIRVGGDRSRVLDEQLAFQNGVLGQETTGAGGLFMAARSIPALKGYCELIKELAPNAWIFNFTNPSGLVTQALRSLGFDRVIGICDTPSSTKLRIAQAMGYDNNEFSMEFFGLNHLSWARQATYRGEQVMERILAEPAVTREVGELSMFDPELIRLIGHIPNEYLYYYYYRDKAAANIRQSGSSRGAGVEQTNIQMLKALREIDVDSDPQTALEIYLSAMYSREATYMQLETTKKVMHTPKELVMPEGEGYAGVAMDFAAAVESGGKRQVVLSVPNAGSIEGLCDDDVIEVTCDVDENGPTPVRIGAAGDEAFALIRAVKTYERLAARAILEGSVELAVRSLMAHPLIGSYNTAKSLIADFVRQQGEYTSHWK